MIKTPAEMMKEYVRSQNFSELSEELGNEKSERLSEVECNNKSKNYRNGYSKKTVKTQLGEIDVRVPRDRNGEYEPKMYFCFVLMV